MNVNPKYPIHEGQSNSFFNEFFYYGHHRYEVIKKLDDKLVIQEIYRPQSVSQIALKVVLMFTAIIPLIAAICLMIQNKKWASFKEIEVKVPLKPDEIIEMINQGKQDIDDLMPEEEFESFLKDHGSKITSLDLRGVDDEKSILTYLRYSPNIATLTLDGGSIEIVNFLSSLTLNNLITLDLRRHPGYSEKQEFRKEAMKILAKSPILTNVTRLYLGRNFIGCKGFKYLSNSEYLNKLELIDLEACDVTDDGVFLLTKSPKFKNVKTAWLSYNDISEVGAQYIARSETLKLTKLFIEGNKLGFPGAAWLAKMPQLEKLDIRYNKYSEVQEPRIKALFSNKKIDLKV